MMRNILFFLLFLICFDFLHAGETNDSSVVKKQICITAFYFQKANIGSRYLSSVHGQDAETGYTDRHARWFDEDALRFVQVDPLVEKYPYISPYSYVLNNPINAIDPNGKEVKFENDEAKEYHNLHYNKLLADGSENKDYNEEYAKVFDEIHGDKNILFIVSKSTENNGKVEIRRDQNLKLVFKDGKLVVDVIFCNTTLVSGGSAKHSYMEEMYHAKQGVDIKNYLIDNKQVLNANVFFSGTIEKEVEAKTWVAKKFNNFDIFWRSGDFEVPTELGIMGDNFRDIDKAQYLKFGLEYPCRNWLSNIYITVLIGRHYSNTPLK